MYADANIANQTLEQLVDRLVCTFAPNAYTAAIGTVATNIKFTAPATSFPIIAGDATTPPTGVTITIASDEVLIASGTIFDPWGGKAVGTANAYGITALANPAGGSGARMAMLYGLDKAKAAYVVCSKVYSGLTGDVQLPQVPLEISSKVCIMGYATVKVTAGNVFIPATTAFSGTGVTAAYVAGVRLFGGETITVS